MMNIYMILMIVIKQLFWKSSNPGPSEPHFLTIMDFDSRPKPCEEPYSDHSTVAGLEAL